MRSRCRVVAVLLVAALLLPVAGTAHSETYAYDGAGRLQHVVYADGTTLAYSYDSRGNRLSRLASPPGTDSDGDGLLDAVETDTGAFVDSSNTGTDPLLADTDGDGEGDAEEIAQGSDPNDPQDPPPVVVPSFSPLGFSALVLILACAGALGLGRLRRRWGSGSGGAAASWLIGLAAAVGGLAPVPAAAGCENVLGPGAGDWVAVNMTVGPTLQTQLSQQDGFSTATLTVDLSSKLTGPTEATLSFHLTTEVTGFGTEITANVIYDFRDSEGNSTDSQVFQVIGEFDQDVTIPIANVASGTESVIMEFDAGWEQVHPFGFFQAPTDAALSGLSLVLGPGCEDTPNSAANRPNSGTTADPINTATGELLEGPMTDLKLGGPSGLAFVRNYASALPEAIEIDGVLGRGWLHNYEMHLDDSSGDVAIQFLWGRSLGFTPAGGGGWQLQSPQDPLFQLVDDGADRVLLDPGSQRMYRFDSSGRLVSIADRNGNTLSLTHAGGVLTGISDGLGRTLSLTYDGNGNLATVSDGTRTVSYQVDGPGDALPGDLTQTTNAAGETALYITDGTGRITSHAHEAGNTPYTQAYDAEGRVNLQTSARAATTSLVYGATETTASDALGGTLQDTYDDAGNLTERVDALGATTTLAYDARNRRTSMTDSEGNATTYAYDAVSGQLATLTRADGTVTSYSFAASTDALGLVFYDVSRIDHPDGSFQTFATDTSGNATSHTGRGGATTAFTHNARGQLLTVTNALGSTTHFTYNADATLASATTAAGDTTTYGYDNLFRLTSQVLPDGATLSFSYDNVDRLTGATDSQGGSSSTVYDANGHPTSRTDRLGNTSTLNWDAMNQLAGTTNPLGHTTTSGYDALDRVASVTNAAGETIAFGRDAVGRVTTITDSGGQVWIRSYDSAGVLQSSTSPQGRTTNLQSDSMGRTTRVTSALGFETDFTYNAMGRVTTWSDPLDRTTSIQYDAGGRVTGISLPGGIASTSYSHNALDQVTQLTDPDGGNWVFAYDNQGRLTGKTDPLGQQTAFSRDSHNRVSDVNFPDAFGSLAYSYDANGNLTQALYSDTTDLSFGYDAVDRLISADGVARSYDNAGRLTEGNGLTFTHDAVGRLQTVTYAPGKTVTYAYDSRGFLSRVTDWQGEAIILSRHPDGDKDALTRSNGVNTTWSYDNDRRITNIAHGALAGVALTYDAAGQLTGATRSGPQSAATPNTGTATQGFDAASQLAGALHDAIGRQTQDGDRTYTWDLASRLASVSEGGTTTQFEYDGLGRRTVRTEGGVTRSYVWNDAVELPSIAIESENGANLRYYVHTPDGALLYSIEASDNSRRYYHFDETGNTTLLTNDAGGVIASYAYGPYGEVHGATQGVDNAYAWQGQMGVAQESDSGLYYARARWYDSTRSRFLSRDPVTTLGVRGSNPYQYAFANPLSFSDPSGLTPASPAAPWYGDTAGDEFSSIAGRAFDAVLDDPKLARFFPNTAGGIGKLLGGAGYVFTPIDEFLGDTWNQTIEGQSLNAVLVTASGWVLVTAQAKLLALPAFASMLVDGTVGYFFGNEYRPGVHQVLFNASRAVVAVGEGLWTGDWSATWALAERMSNSGFGATTRSLANQAEEAADWWYDLIRGRSADYYR